MSSRYPPASVAGEDVVRSWRVLLAGGLVLLVWSGGVVWWSTTDERQTATRVEIGARTAREVRAAVPLAALELRPLDGGLILAGEVPSAEVETELLSKAQTMYAPLTVQDGLRVRPEAAESGWLALALAGLPLPMPGIEQPEWLLSAEGLRVGGVAVDDAAREALRAQLAQRFPDIPWVEGLRLATPTVAVTAEPRAPDPESGRGDPPVIDAATRAAHPRQAELDAMLAARPVVFASGSTRLRRDAGPDWKALADLIESAGPVRVLVRGHTDDRGRPEANRRLSARRAEAVKQALVRAGWPAARIDVEGLGAEQPLVSNATAEGRRQNRRIEIRLIAETGA